MDPRAAIGDGYVVPRRQRWSLPFGWWWCLAAPPMLLLLDLAVALARGFTTTSAVWIVVGSGSLLVLGGACGLISTPRRRQAFARHGVRWGAVSIAFWMAWFTAEVVVETLFAPGVTFHLAAPRARHEFRPLPEVLRGLSPIVRFTTNSRGVRGPEWPARSAARRVLCIGGSTTECAYLDDAETWPALVAASLQAAGLPVWVGDVGRSGFASAQHLRFLLENELLQEVDDVVVLVGINDLGRALQGRRLHVVAGREPWFLRSPILRLVDNLLQAHRLRRRMMVEDPGGASYAQRRLEHASRPLATQLPDLADSLREYRANLQAIVDRCRSLGVRVCFATQPVRWRADLPAAEQALLWIGRNAAEQRLPLPWLAGQMTAFNDEVRACCRQHAIPCIDLEPLGAEAACFYDDCHFTRHGAERVAAAVARVLSGT